jgi:SAM-dependent methyltransferase
MLLVVGIGLVVGCGEPASRQDDRSDGMSVEIVTINGVAYGAFKSEHFDQRLLVLRGVLAPDEAEVRVLPYMREHPGLFKDKVVLDIGTGSGVLGLYAARLGARKVVATDIDRYALHCAKLNAERMNVNHVFETRLVPLSDLSAFSVIREDEVFDTIISNPPFTLDLEAESNSIYVDTGDLGFSIVRGLERHLAPDGVAVLFYGSLFYHRVMVEFARYTGYEVEQEDPNTMTPWERDILFNSYLRRLLIRENVDPDAFRFDWQKEREKHEETLRIHMNERSYKGLMMIRKPSGRGATSSASRGQLTASPEGPDWEGK